MRHARLFAAAIIFTAPAFADDPPKPFTIVTPKNDGIIATDINERGDVIGFEWVENEKDQGVVDEKPFIFRSGTLTYLPLLDGYTATHPAAISDDGVVVGRASKPAPPEVVIPFRNQAFVWDAERGIRGLGAPEGDHASYACGISRDGRRISGYSIGKNRIRACYWDRDGDRWKAITLPQSTELDSTVVAISDDGKRITCVNEIIPSLWTETAPGEWTREPIGDPGAFTPRAVNDSGTVVGIRHTPDGFTHAVIWTRGEGLKQVEKPQGYVRSEANAINNAGVVVGMIDGPFGSKTITPKGFAFEAGKLQFITQVGLPFVSATAINDQRQVAGVLEKDEEAVDEQNELKPR